MPFTHKNIKKTALRTKLNIMEATLFLSISFLLLSFTTNPVPCLATSAPQEVRDTAGKILRTGTNYYILPVFHGHGGGLKLASAGNKTCPLDVVQEPREISHGLPLKLTPVNYKKGVIRVSTDLNIKFSPAATMCRQSTVWRLDDYDKKTGQRFVSSGGVEGNPGPATLSNWFKIEKLGAAYKLVFCPSVCHHCKVACRDIGVYIDKVGMRRLALSDKPLKVVFKKV
ncbi:kunitz trypsin inhibitor 5 [Ziziphus jujuba]|uniref:Kunitz trypsin inhibitor 5 n=1 Tax=Ziziphus jujuba TaxID=326968 RepID=A0A6P3ZVM1_ZIZJJ|nr:kunitz trypsin inhibitor 5 [Ziziphus jujuba]